MLNTLNQSHRSHTVNGNPTFSLAVTWIQLHNEWITGVLTVAAETGDQKIDCKIPFVSKDGVENGIENTFVFSNGAILLASIILRDAQTIWVRGQLDWNGETFPEAQNCLRVS
jgi:hypothetical protein